MAGMKHRRQWREVIRRQFTRDSILKAARSGNMEDLEEKRTEGSVCDSCHIFLDRSLEDRRSAYLDMVRMMPNASSGTLRKMRKRLQIDG